jgi:2EXR family protein
MYQLSYAGLSALLQSLPLPRFGATAGAETSTAGMFHFFPLLPLEIRLQIWRMALLEPAVWFATFPEFRDMKTGEYDVEKTHDRGNMTVT